MTIPKLTFHLGSGKTFDNTAGLIKVGDTSTLALPIGSLLLGDGSKLRFDVGTGSGGHARNGLITLASNVTLDGVLVLDLSHYSASVGDSFTVLTDTGSLSGTFDNVLAAGYTVSTSYGLNDVTVTITGVSAVPEPGTLAMWLAGMFAVGGGAMRRKIGRR